MRNIATTRPYDETDATNNAPTGVRWRILALLMAYAGLCHFNRVSISVAGTEHIMKDYSIDQVQMGMVYSSYLFVYTLCMIPGGWLIDHFGPKKALMFLGFGSAILVPATGLTSFTTAAGLLAVLSVIRGLLGFVSAPMHPAAAKALSSWMPTNERGAANGMVTGAAVLGVASTYFVFGFLMDLVGWPSAFLVAGVVTLLLTIVWSLYATDDPSRHVAVDARERRLIEGAEAGWQTRDANSPELPSGIPDEMFLPPVEEADRQGRVGFLALLCDRNLVLLTISYATASYFQYLFFYWMQYYFDEVMKLGKADSRIYATLPTLAMAVGMMIGGRLADRARIRFGSRRGRAIVPAVSLTSSAILLYLGIFGSQPVWVVTCFALAMGALGASESSFWVTGVEIGRRRGGLSGAILNAGGNVGGILAPIITPLFSKSFGWQAGLGLAGALCLFGAVIWRWIDVREGQDPTGQTPAIPPAHRA